MRLVSSIFQSRRKRGERVGASAIKLLHENKMQGFSLFIERDISDKKQIVFLNSLFQQQIQLSQLPTRRFYVFVFNKNFCKNKQQFNVWLFLIKVRLEQLARTTETKTKSGNNATFLEIYTSSASFKLQEIFIFSTVHS